MKNIQLHIFIPLIIFFGISVHSFANKNPVDSLQQVLKHEKSPDKKCATLNELSRQNWRVGNYDTAFYYANRAYKLASNTKNKLRMADAQVNMGIVHEYTAKFEASLKNYQLALKLYKDIGDKKGIAASYNNMGIFYDTQGNYPEAIKNYLLALRLREEMKDTIGIAAAYHNIGVIHAMESDFDEALENLNRGKELRLLVNDLAGLGDSYIALGNVHDAIKKFPEALEFHMKGLDIQKKLGNPERIALAYSSIGNAYNSQKQFSKAIEYYQKAIEIREQIGDVNGLALTYGSMGNMYLLMRNGPEAKKWLEKALAYSLEQNYKDFTQNLYLNLASVDSLLGNYQAALYDFQMHIKYYDSIYNEESTRKQTELKMQYTFDKKQVADSIRDVNEHIIHATQVRQDKIIRWLLYAGIAAAFVFAIFMVNRFRVTNRQKKIIELKEQETQKQNEIIFLQKLMVEEKQKEILDSIHYAKRIQDAQLPGIKYIERILKRIKQ